MIRLTRRSALLGTLLAAAPGLGGGHGPLGHALGVVPLDVIVAGKC